MRCGRRVPHVQTVAIAHGRESAQLRVSPRDIASPERASHAPSTAGRSFTSHARGTHEPVPHSSWPLSVGCMARYLPPPTPGGGESDPALGQAMGLGDTLPSELGGGQGAWRPLPASDPKKQFRRLPEPQHFPSHAEYKPGAEEGVHVGPPCLGLWTRGALRQESAVDTAPLETLPRPELHSAQPNAGKPHPQPPRSQERAKNRGLLLSGETVLAAQPPPKRPPAARLHACSREPLATPTRQLGNRQL